MYWWSYIYHLTKWYELIDSIIIVLRKSKKGLSYLHVLHHAGMLMMVDLWFYAGFGALWGPPMVNSMVHVIMYLYYGMTALGHRWKLRNYITIIQLIQFSLGGIYFLIYLPGRLFFNLDANGNLIIMCVSCFVDLYIFYLFFDFYKKEYVEKKNNIKGKKKEENKREMGKMEEGRIKKEGGFSSFSSSENDK